MSVYHEYYGAKRVALVYPGKVLLKLSGVFLDPHAETSTDKECSVISIAVGDTASQWQRSISTAILNWIAAPR